MDDVRDRLSQLAELAQKESLGKVFRDVLLSGYSSWGIGGSADLLIEPADVDHLQRILQWVRAHACPVLVIGHGTNLLFDDSGFRGVVLRIADNFSRIAIQGTSIRAQAGVWVPRLARCAATSGLGGFEHTIGIPGTLGGLVVMNGGSQRKAIGDNVRSVRALDYSGNVRHFIQDECRFQYRQSAFQGEDLVITEVELSGTPGDKHAIRREMLAILRERNRKFPRKQPNCGSVFVSGGEMYNRFGPPGKVIEQLGLKGFRIGDAQVSPRHANFIVNLGEASSSDVLSLIHLIRTRVKALTGLWLTCEVRYVAPHGGTLPASETDANTLPFDSEPGHAPKREAP